LDEVFGKPPVAGVVLDGWEDLVEEVSERSCLAANGRVAACSRLFPCNLKSCRKGAAHVASGDHHCKTNERRTIMKRILIINPNTAKETAETMEAQCRQIAGPDTFVAATYLKPRPGFSSYKVFSYVDLAICTMESIKVAWRNRHDFDGIIVAGFSDVGVDAMKEILDIPVLGIAEASYHMASLVSHRFAVLTGTSKWTPPKDDYVRALGVETRVASIRSYSEWDESDSFEVLKERLLKIARRTMDEDGAEAVILGGGPLVGYGKILQEELGIPVIDPTIAAFKLMESMIDLGYCQSKRNRWSKPLEKLGDASGFIPYDRGWLDES
jgi:allantoin racemase